MTLWKISNREFNFYSPHRRNKKISYPIQRASLCTCQKGSYTLEAAVVIPLLAMYLVTLLFFFSILQIQCKVDEALLYAGRKTAVESSIVDSEELLFLSAEGYLLYALRDHSLVEQRVKHGAWGVQLWKSYLGEEWIILRAEYSVELPIPFLGISEIELTSQNVFRKWLGDRPEQNQEGMVYVTKQGEVYHAGLSCRSIQLSVKETSIDQILLMRGNEGQKYYECTRCDWADNGSERVYYTDYGTLYHKSISCSAIKRTVEKIKLEDVGGRRPCKWCYE